MLLLSGKVCNFQGFWLENPSILHTVYPTQGHGDPGAYPKELRAQGRGHIGWSANPSQDRIRHYRQLGNANHPTARPWKPEYPEEGLK